jgi:biopolymer transport protein ExbB/TolQ
MKTKWLSYRVATLLWLACFYEVSLVALRAYQGRLGETPIFGQLLTRGVDSIAPIAVLGVLAWLLLDILLHTVRVWREQQAVQQMIGIAPARLQPGQIPAHSRAARRVQLVKDHYAASPQHLHDALPAAAALDAAVLENTYGLTKAYVWTLPVLGFIGTAWGMAHAIGGFSQALQETTEAKILTDRLGQLVIPGLSNAFAVTMLALGASIVAHFCVTTVQSWDQDVLDNLDRVSVDLLTKIPQRRDGATPFELVQALQELINQLAQLNQKLNLGDAANLLTGAADRLSQAANGTLSAAGALRDSVNLPYHVTITRGEKR